MERVPASQEKLPLQVADGLKSQMPLEWYSVQETGFRTTQFNSVLSSRVLWMPARCQVPGARATDEDEAQPERCSVSGDGGGHKQGGEDSS